MANDDDASKIKECGWRQGSVLPPSLFARVQDNYGVELRPDEHCVIVASQDCDVVHSRYSVEPWVEIILAARKEKVDGNLLYAKSARRLQFELECTSGKVTYELSVHERAQIDRRILRDAKPDATISLSESQKKQLAGWLAKRYQREALPDALVDRLKAQPQRDHLRKLLKEWGGLISAVFLLITPDEELPPERTYVVAVAYAIVWSEMYEDPENQRKLHDDFQPRFEEALKAFAGITVKDAIAISDEEFSLADLRATKRMDLDDLSYRDDGPIARSL